MEVEPIHRPIPCLSAASVVEFTTVLIIPETIVIGP